MVLWSSGTGLLGLPIGPKLNLGYLMETLCVHLLEFWLLHKVHPISSVDILAHILDHAVLQQQFALFQLAVLILF